MTPGTAALIPASVASHKTSCILSTSLDISPIAPFGGFKNSGYGRESGLEVMKDYSNTKTTWINTSTKEIDDPFIIR